MSANEKQVGGNHYKDLGDLQHWDVVHRLKWCYLVGAATKYLWRLGKKGAKDKQIEDVEKAIHFLEKKREQLIHERESAPARTRDKCDRCHKPVMQCDCQKSLFCWACILDDPLEGIHTCGAEPTRSYVDQD